MFNGNTWKYIFICGPLFDSYVSLSECRVIHWVSLCHCYIMSAIVLNLGISRAQSSKYLFVKRWVHLPQNLGVKISKSWFIEPLAIDDSNESQAHWQTLNPMPRLTTKVCLAVGGKR